jgi:precorrin-8X/cobalt-precorrin-8 methylmutase
MFDTFVMVDWSAANAPRTGRDSIWICWLGPNGERLENPQTRRDAKVLLADWLAAARANGERVLVGFDFPFGYPAGFAALLSLSGPPWRAVWNEIARLIADDKDNRSNRFKVAAALNERIATAGGGSPFWGCPAAEAGPRLRPTRPTYECGLAERRFIDRREYMPGAQPCWKLCYPGSVGSQVLTGIPVVRALRDDPRWTKVTRVWPFETGLRPPDDAELVFAEVYPSFWKKIPPLAGKPKDAAQVHFVTRFFAECDRSGDLADLFFGDAGLSPEQRRLVETEEAWTLGVTVARRPNRAKKRAEQAAAWPE